MLTLGLLFGVLLAVLPEGGLAQQFDTTITEQNQTPKSISSEIRNPAEREAYQRLFKKAGPDVTARRAEEFLSRYPQSWELAQVYGIAAKANINLGNYPKALRFAAQSFQLYPENPLLLVLVANVQAQTGDFVHAEQSARDALQYLERFDRPGSVSKRAWPELKRGLEASSYFAIARAEVSEVIGSPDVGERATMYREAVSCLTRARELNPKDAEIAYLLALANLGLSRPRDAAVSFAAVAASNGPLQERALNHLHELYEAAVPKPAPTFESYVESFESQASAQLRVQRPLSGAQTLPPLPGYAGSQECRYCHSNIYQAWQHTGMAKMFRPYKPQNVIGDFTVHNAFYGGDETSFQDGQFKSTPGNHRWPFARMIVVQGRHYFETLNDDGRWHRYPVDYTIGSKWEQGYATRLPNGEIQVFPIQYNRLLKRWVDFWGIIDLPGSPRADLHEWGKMAIWTDYQANCAVCHTSQLRNPDGGGFAPQGVTFREPGVDCEMCHGPSARHVAAMMKGEVYPKRPLDPPVDFSKISARDFIAICSQCHMQSAVRVPGPHGELNYSIRGEFFTRYKSRPYDEFSRLGFYKDGRFRQSTFIVEALMRSECFRKGNVTCADCHDVHSPNAASNPRLLKYSPESNQMCTQCHTVFKDQGVLVQHTHHVAASEGSRCVSCHMPRIMDALLFMTRTHRIDDIPNVLNTERFGQRDSPNACLLCHTDKDALWARQQLVAWKAPTF